MAEYISRDSAMRAIIDKQRDHTTPWRLSYELGKKHAADEYVEVLMAVPAADVVAVVRCRDCKYLAHFTDGHNECRLLADLRPVPCTYLTMKDTDFCSYGERRTDNG